MEEFQTYTNPTFQHLDLEDNGYSSSDPSPLSSKESLFSHPKTKSFDIVIMLVMGTEVVDFKEQLASIKAIWIGSPRRAQKKTPKSSFKK